MDQSKARYFLLRARLHDSPLSSPDWATALKMSTIARTEEEAHEKAAKFSGPPGKNMSYVFKTVGIDEVLG